MKTNPKGKQLCKKLKFGDPEKPSIILGIIVQEDNDFLVFRTAHREYRISRRLILSIEDTDAEFKGGSDD